MYTERELPFLIERSKPVLSSTVPFAKVFSAQTSRPATEKVFSISNNMASMPFAVILAILAFVWLGRR